MKKLMLIVGLLMIAGIPLMAAEVTVSGVIDVNYFVMDTPTDDNDDEPSEGYFNEVCAGLKVSAELDEGLKGVMKLAVVEPKSDGVDSGGWLEVEEMYVAKTNAFDVEGLGFVFGKMEVPGNMDIDAGITHSLSWLYEMDETWGLTASYALTEGNIGTFSLTSFEGEGGLDLTAGEDPEDEDSGLLTSLALQWDTGEDAFEVEGLRLVVAYVMIAQDDDLDNGSNISIGGTYTLKDMGLKFGLEIDMSTSFFNLNDLSDGAFGSYVLQEGCMLIALNVDYDIPEQPFSVGLSYEMLTINEDTTDEVNAVIGDDLESNTTTRLALRGDYNVVEDGSTKIRFEYASLSNDHEAVEDEFGGSTLAVGVLAKF